MKPCTPAPAKRNTRAEARALFPTWTRKAHARWVLARLRTITGTWATRVGVKHMNAPDHIPDFVRTLPPGPPLEIKLDTADKVRGAVRYLKGVAK